MSEPSTTQEQACRVIVTGHPCGESRATHENGTLWVHAFAPDGLERPNPNLRLIDVGHPSDDFATGF